MAYQARHDVVRNRPKRRHSSIKTHVRRRIVYGLTREAAFKLWLDQDCRCAVCREKEFFEMLQVDHDHCTGKVRGLLCGRCNTQVSAFQHGKDYPSEIAGPIITFLAKAGSLCPL